MSKTVRVPYAVMFLMMLFALFAFQDTAFCKDGKVSVSINSGKCEMNQANGVHEVSLQNYGMNFIPGAPNLPAKIHAIAVPPGAVVTGITYETFDAYELPGEYHIKPVHLPRALGLGVEKPELYAADKAKYDNTLDTIYNSDAVYPSQVAELVRTAGYRKYNLVDVRVQPFAYQPKSGKLTYYPNVVIDVHYTLPKECENGAMPASYRYDNIERTEKVAQGFIHNYDQAQGWYPPAPESAGKTGLYSFVIITTNANTSTVQDLVDWESKKDNTVNVVTTTWINANYTGYDTAERIRNFLRDKYPQEEWGIEDVLIVGHYDNVPMRRTDQDVGYGRPETDLYYAELSLPDDESWDKDQDHKWGGPGDFIDFYSEVNVGRIPWTTSSTVSDICDKTIAFEVNQDPSFKKNMLLLGAFFWPNTDNAVLMEYKTNPANNPWMADWTRTRLYEAGHSSYPMDHSLGWTNTKNVWSGGKFAFVNWGGHGSPTGCYTYYSSGSFSSTSTCNYLNDNYPSIVFAAACSNSDTDHTNLGQCMLRQGAVGFLGATKVAYGTMGWNNPQQGSCQSLDYFFTSNVTSCDYTLGQGHQAALRKVYAHGMFSKGKYEMFEWGALWGNPNLTMGELPEVYLKFPEGVPEGTQFPGLSYTIPIEIVNGTSDYVPGTAKLFYRFDSGSAYTQVPFTSLGGNQYEVVLPATSPGDAPEFYFSAQCTAGDTVYYPKSAPSEPCAFDVYFENLMWEDDFETHQGWTVENVDVDDGEWELGTPEFTYTQPEGDHTPNGDTCWVTGAAFNGSPYFSDVDGGPTRLISPTIDLSTCDAALRFYLWYYQSVFGIDQPLEIHISNDNGASWVLMDTVEDFNKVQWTAYEYMVSDYVTPTGQVKIRFSACDNPDDGIVEALLDDFTVVEIVVDPSLWADNYSVEVSAASVVNFTIDAGAGNANRTYLLLGSLSGTSPGFTLPGGMVLPLNWDSFTDIIMGFVGSPVCSNFLGTLDGSGRSTAQLNTFGPVDPGLIGAQADFAFCVSAPFDFVSNSMPVTFDP